MRDGRQAALRFRPLLLLTSVLGLAWNLCALPAYELPKRGIEGPFPYLAAIGFAALGFLPAVVVHSVLRDERHVVRGAVEANARCGRVWGERDCRRLHRARGSERRRQFPRPSACGS